MAKNAYIGVGGVARKVKGMYIGVNGAARKVKKGYIGVNGAARLFYSGGVPVTITLTSDGANNECYIAYNGRSYYTRGDTFTVNSGDKITLAVKGGLNRSTYIIIDGSYAITRATYIIGLRSCEWTVPNGISAISVAMTFRATAMAQINAEASIIVTKA